MDATEKAYLEKEYYAHLGRRASRAMAERVESGLPVCRPPLGYRLESGNGGRHPVPDEESAPLVRKAFLLAAEGRYSVREILSRLEKDGLRAQGGGRLGPSALWSVLKNPFYAGHLRYKGRLVEGSHEPVVSRETFDRVQESLERRRRSAGRGG